LQEILARLGAQLTYRVATEELAYLLGIHVSKKYTEYIGEKAIIIEPEEVKFKKHESISMQADGGRINTLEDGWREVKVGVVAGSAGKKVQMSMICEHEKFMDKYCNFIRENGYHTHPGVINFVSDGAKWLQDDFKQRFPKIPQALDYFHFKEHLHETAEEIYSGEKVEADFWVERIKELAFENKSEEIIDVLTLEWQFQNDEENRNASESVRKLGQYLFDNRERIRYGEFEKKGYEIGSGKVEATIKVQLDRRMKSASSRWRLQNAKKVLAIRDLRFNSQWHLLEKAA